MDTNKANPFKGRRDVENAIDDLTGHYLLSNAPQHARWVSTGFENNSINSVFNLGNLDGILFERNSKYVCAKITCRVYWPKKHLYCTAELVYDQLNDDYKMPVSLVLLQAQVNEVCKKLIEEQCQVLSAAGIKLSVDEVIDWDFLPQYYLLNNLNEKIYGLLNDYHLQDLNRKTRNELDFIVNSISRFTKEGDVFHKKEDGHQEDGHHEGDVNRVVVVDAYEIPVDSIQDKNNTEVTVGINYKINTHTDALSFECVAGLRSKEMGVNCDLPISLDLQKEIHKTCESLAIDIKYFLSISGIKLLSVNSTPAWFNPDYLEQPLQRPVSEYEEWSDEGGLIPA